MALSLGQLVGGAGIVATRQRQAEEAERVARLNQLSIEERNRQELLRREMLQAPMAAPQGGLQLPEPLGTRPIVQALKVSTAPAAAPAAGITTPAAGVTPPAAPDNTYEGIYERIRPALSSWNMSRVQNIVGALPEETKNTIAFLKDPKKFSTEEIAGIYAVALTKEDTNTSNYLRDVLLSRGISDAELRNIQKQTRVGLRVVKETEAAETKRAAEKRRQFELKTGRKVSDAVSGVAIPESTAPAAQGVDASSAIARVIEREGGNRVTDDKDDMGGLTKFGISKNAYPNLDIANLTEAEAAAIYKRDYWDKINADQLPVNIREAAFDAAVNHGVNTAKRLLSEAGNDLQKFLELRANLYQQIVDNNPTQAKFLNGWMKRLRDLASGVVSAVVPTAVAAAAPAPTAAPAPAPAAAPAGVNTNLPQRTQLYLANPQAIPFEMQRSMQQREELARLAGMYQRSGMGQQFMETRARVMELDNNMLYLQGMQGIQEFSLANDPRRLAAVWSAYSGMDVGVQPRSDGRFDILVGGQRAREGLAPTELVDMARLSFDSGYRQEVARAAAEARMETFKSQLEIDKERAKQTAQMIRDIAVARTQGDINAALEWVKTNLKYEVNSTPDGSVLIKVPGSTRTYVFNPSGREIEVDGVKVKSMDATPISGMSQLSGMPQPKG